jgi:diguanylate cyclase (GGDEF)-like protein
MNMIKAAAGLPRRLRDIRNTSLTTRTGMVVALVGLSVWLLLDITYQRSAQQELSARLHQQLHAAAVTERGRIRKSLGSFLATAHYLASYQPLHKRLRNWSRSRTARTVPVVSQWKPDWLPGIKSVDERIGLDVATVLGTGRETYAVYANGRRTVPETFLEPDIALLQGAMNGLQVYVHDSVAYLLSAAPVRGDDGRVLGSVMIAARIDNEFLAGIVESPAAHTVSGLLLGGRPLPVALLGLQPQAERSDYRLGGPATASLLANELLVESDGRNTLRHAVWADSRQVEALGEPFLFSVRQQRTVTIAVFALLLVVVIAGIARRIKKLHGSVEHYSRRLGVAVPRLNRGDPITSLATRLERLSEEILAETYMLEYQARHDSLTNLPNRALLLDHLENELHNALETSEPLALFVMDLDRFKEVNDTLGHHVGDRLLQEVSRRLVSVLRRTDTVARLGGDEFAVLLPGADDERSRSVCKKILAALDRPIKVENLQLRAGISIGVALCPEDGQDANLLMQRADVAMYEAKRHQHGFAFYAADRDDNSISRLGLAAELREAIEHNELMLEYQPMVDIRTGRIFCAEALVRWSHPRYGCVPPEEFICIAEQTGVIRPLTLWVIDQALGQAAAWRRAGIDLRVSVNLSVRSLQDRKLPGQVQKLVDKHFCDPDTVILEITESALMSDPLTARRVMRRLSNMGFQISIDDFGTGYSSLAYLKQLPVDEIKIDRSFVTRMDRDENDAVIVRATIDLAHNLGLKVVAEGVESSDVWDLLEMLGCDTAQGYFIRKPLQPGELASWIESKAWAGSRWDSPVPVAG